MKPSLTNQPQQQPEIVIIRHLFKKMGEKKVKGEHNCNLLEPTYRIPSERLQHMSAGSGPRKLYPKCIRSNSSSPPIPSKNFCMEFFFKILQYIMEVKVKIGGSVQQ